MSRSCVAKSLKKTFKQHRGKGGGTVHVCLFKIRGYLFFHGHAAARPAEDRQASSRTAAGTRYRNVVGPAALAQEGQEQDYNAEMRGATWKVERDEGKNVQQQLRAGDEEADAVNAARDRNDPDYKPTNPREEVMEREFRGE